MDAALAIGILLAAVFVFVGLPLAVGIGMAVQDHGRDSPTLDDETKQILDDWTGD